MLEAAFGENGRAEYDGEELLYHEQAGNIEGRFIMEGSRYSLNAKAAEKYLTPNVFEINKSITDGRTSLLIQAGLYDQQSMAGILYMTMEDTNGFQDVHIWSNGEISWLNENNEERFYLDTSASNLFYVVEEERTDTCMGIICAFSHAEGEEYLEVFYKETGESISIALPQSQSMEHICFADGEVILTPISLMLDIERFEASRPFEDGIITIQMKDGTESIILWHDQYKPKTVFDRTPIKDPILNYYLMTGYPVNDYTVQRGYLLKFAVDIENVESITVNEEVLFPK